MMLSYHEGNGCVDKLANLGFPMDVDFHLLDIMPTVVSFQLRADAAFADPQSSDVNIL